MRHIVALASYVCLALVLLATPGQAQEDKDNTGTNPVNFTYDLRFITEMQSFRDDGGSLLKHTLDRVEGTPGGRHWESGRGQGLLRPGKEVRCAHAGVLPESEPQRRFR